MNQSVHLMVLHRGVGSGAAGEAMALPLFLTHFLNILQQAAELLQQVH